MDVRIEPESPADADAIRHVLRAAFEHEPEVADLVDAIRASPQYEPELSLLARLCGRVVGFVMVSHASVVGHAGGSAGAPDPADAQDSADRAGTTGAPSGSSPRADGAVVHDVPTFPPLAVVHDVLTLSPLAVAPEQQRHGIGSALVREVLAAAARTSAPLVTLEGSPAYYGRLGFGPAADAGIGMRLPDWAPREAAQVYRLPGYRPEVRGRLIYPPAFDAVT